MKLTLEHIATAFEKDLFDRTETDQQGLILLVKRMEDDKRVKRQIHVQGDAEDIGTALYLAMTENPEFANIILASAKMYENRHIPNLDNVIESLETAYKAVDNVCKHFEKRAKKNRRK